MKSKIKLYDFQRDVLEQSKNQNKVAYFYEMGLGKTFIGSEKAFSFDKTILVVCQKSKIKDWINHFKSFYSGNLYDLTKEKELNEYLYQNNVTLNIGVINYDLVWRRTDLLKLKDFTLLLDESSLIQNKTKRSKFIAKLNFENLILLSGTPVSGKYEKLINQINLLGWNISEKLFWQHYVVYDYLEVKRNTFIKNVKGYKNVERLKSKLNQFCYFKKSEEVLNLPKQNFVEIEIDENPQYKKFKKNKIITINDETLVGDTSLKRLLYSRMLCSGHNDHKIDALKDLLNSTEDRFIIFYNFNIELEKIKSLCDELERPFSIVNGEFKNLNNFNQNENGVAIVQYQAGAMGLNLQNANKIIYFSLTLSSDLFEQSKKRIHRIGQEKPCFYYILKCGIEKNILETLKERKDYTDELFKKTEKN